MGWSRTDAAGGTVNSGRQPGQQLFPRPSEYKSASIHKADDRSTRPGAGLRAVRLGVCGVAKRFWLRQNGAYLTEEKGGKA